MTSRKNDFLLKKSFYVHSNVVTRNLLLVRQELKFEFVAFFSFKGQVQNKIKRCKRNIQLKGGIECETREIIQLWISSTMKVLHRLYNFLL